MFRVIALTLLTLLLGCQAGTSPIKTSGPPPRPATDNLLDSIDHNAPVVLIVRPGRWDSARNSLLLLTSRLAGPRWAKIRQAIDAPTLWQAIGSLL